mgnify:CR=1 FL=1|tara:strand:- start:2913 stop:3065 length:153 start_codon:yes stop_codon:yes gene_type:complete
MSIQLKEQQKKIKMEGIHPGVKASLQYDPNSTKQFHQNKEWIQKWLKKNK